jgi:hypothetical protein
MGAAEDAALLRAAQESGDVAAARAALDGGADTECSDEQVRCVAAPAGGGRGCAAARQTLLDTC